jgi:Mn2+/Fe2+ NRAMP family transporter
VNFLTLLAEIGGVALAIELATGVNHLLWVPLVGFGVWLTIWRVRFSTMERLFGLLGLCLVVFVVAVVDLGPDWADIVHQTTHPGITEGEGTPTYWFFAVSLFGAAMTPYEVFFFSSGAVEERWTTKDLSLNRINVFLGFPLGGLLSLALMSLTALVFLPLGVSVDHLGQVALPVALSLGKIGLAFALVGFFAATFGAALETGLSAGYTVSQYLGWQWGKFVEPLRAARFHTVLLLATIAAVALLLTTVDPIMLTEYSVVFSAVALPLTYLPILVVANDRTYMGDDVNGPIKNTIATCYLVLLVVVAVATIPLMIATKAGS